MTLDLLNLFWKDTQSGGEYRRFHGALRVARPFSLDENVCEGVNELAFAEDLTPYKLRRYLAGARLPFEVVWIEAPRGPLLKHLFYEDRELEGGREGWLLKRLPMGGSDDLDESFTIHSVLSSTDKDTGQQHSVVRILAHVVSRFGGISYGRDEVVLDQTRDDLLLGAIDSVNSRLDLPLFAWGVDATQMTRARARRNPLYGCNLYLPIGYNSTSMLESMARKLGDTKENVVTKLISRSLKEQAGELRWVVTALALLNEVPVIYTPFRPKGLMRYNSALKPYLSSTVVTISLPARRRRVKDYQKDLIRAGREAEASKRRAHDVKGHFRRSNKQHGPRWEAFIDRDGRLRYRRWIKEHVRGNGRIGFNDHIYAVVGKPDLPERLRPSAGTRIPEPSME